MKRHHLWVVAGLGVAASLAAVVGAQPEGAQVPYPEGFRRWAHVKTGANTKPGPGSPTSGSFHHIYANGPALAGYATGTFADGSVLAFDRLALVDNGGNLSEGPRLVLDVMVKDAAKYAATGGWGFEEFAGNSTTERRIGANATTACFNCHAKTSPTSYVISTLRE